MTSLAIGNTSADYTKVRPKTCRSLHLIKNPSREKAQNQQPVRHKHNRQTTPKIAKIFSRAHRCCRMPTPQPTAIDQSQAANPQVNSNRPQHMESTKQRLLRTVNHVKTSACLRNNRFAVYESNAINSYSFSVSKCAGFNDILASIERSPYGTTKPTLV